MRAILRGAHSLAHVVGRQGVFPYFVPFDSVRDGRATCRERPIVMMGSNDYLGLASDARVIDAYARAADRFGTGCSGSRFLNGNLSLHEELEDRLAAFCGKEEALLFSNGFLANVGAVACLVGPDEFVISDKDAHASIIDGTLLALKARRLRFWHNDPVSLENAPRTCPADAAKLVVVEGVYSLTGDIVPLRDVVALCEAHHARLLLDDAHGLGVLGGGHGTAAEFGLTGKVDLIVGTFSKALASIGGFIAGRRDVIHYIRFHARPLIFSAALPAGNTAAVLKCLEFIESEPERVWRLAENAERMRSRLSGLGFDVGGVRGPICRLPIGDSDRVFEVWRRLFEAGLYVNPIIPPAVPQGQGSLRISCTAAHTGREIDWAAGVLGEVARGLVLLR